MTCVTSVGNVSIRTLEQRILLTYLAKIGGFSLWTSRENQFETLVNFYGAGILIGYNLSDSEYHPSTRGFDAHSHLCPCSKWISSVVIIKVLSLMALTSGMPWRQFARFGSQIQLQSDRHRNRRQRRAAYHDQPRWWKCPHWWPVQLALYSGGNDVLLPYCHVSRSTISYVT